MQCSPAKCSKIPAHELGTTIRQQGTSRKGVTTRGEVLGFQQCAPAGQNSSAGHQQEDAHNSWKFSALMSSSLTSPSSRCRRGPPPLRKGRRQERGQAIRHGGSQHRGVRTRCACFMSQASPTMIKHATFMHLSVAQHKRNHPAAFGGKLKREMQGKLKQPAHPRPRNSPGSPSSRRWPSPFCQRSPRPRSS